MRRHALCLLALVCLGRQAPAANCAPEGWIRYEPRTFFGYECPDDCERHKVGYAWAERAGFVDVRECAAFPDSLREGCTARIELASTSEAAGHRWALENEVVQPCECAGAGERFEAGCLRQLLGTHRRGVN